jgi:hypothetical protein
MEDNASTVTKSLVLHVARACAFEFELEEERQKVPKT